MKVLREFISTDWMLKWQTWQSSNHPSKFSVHLCTKTSLSTELQMAIQSRTTTLAVITASVAPPGRPTPPPMKPKTKERHSMPLTLSTPTGHTLSKLLALSSLQWNCLFTIRTTLKYFLVVTMMRLLRTLSSLRRTSDGSTSSTFCQLTTSSQLVLGRSLTSTTFWMKILCSTMNEQKYWYHEFDSYLNLFNP